MRDRSFAAHMLTFYILNLFGIGQAYASAPRHQLVSFDDLTGHLSPSVVSNALFPSYLSICFSAFIPDNLNELQTNCAGMRSMAVPCSRSHLNRQGLTVFLANHALDPRYRRGTMADSNRDIYFLRTINSPTDTPSVGFERKDNNSNICKIIERRRLSFSTSSQGKPPAVTFPRSRCSEKGCVFPASSVNSGKCSYHMHQQEEPVLFCSHQPTGLLLDPTRTEGAEKEYDGNRRRDRRRMAAIWEQFQSDETP